MNKEHEDDHSGNVIKHRKLNRKNNEVVDCSSHFSEELFPDLLENLQYIDLEVIIQNIYIQEICKNFCKEFR